MVPNEERKGAAWKKASKTALPLQKHFMAVLRLGRGTSSCKLFPSCLFASLLSGQPQEHPAARAAQVGGTALPTWEITTVPRGHSAAQTNGVLPIAISIFIPFFIKAERQEMSEKKEAEPGQKTDCRKIPRLTPSM